MSGSNASIKGRQHITPPSSFVDAPLTPPPTDEKAFTQAPRIISLLKDIQAGRHIEVLPWTVFQLARGEYEDFQRRLHQDELLFGYAKDKIRYDYDVRTNQLVVRMPTGIHELFTDSVEDAIRSQLKVIRSGSDKAALFAQRVRPARSTEIYFPVDEAAPGTKSKHEPDSSFWHDDAEYPGVIIEVAYSQKRKKLNRLAEDYLLDSDASIKIVVGLDIEYGKKGSRKATLSVWRTEVVQTLDGEELRVSQEVADEFRDEHGNPTDHPGLRLRLSDFACEELAEDVVQGEHQEIVVTTQQLCQFLNAAEDKIQGQRPLVKHSIRPGVKKRKRSETPSERMASGDETRYLEQEERAAKRMAENDPDYENKSISSTSE